MSNHNIDARDAGVVNSPVPQHGRIRRPGRDKGNSSRIRRVAKELKRVISEVFWKKAPLNEFMDYEEYWSRRYCDGRISPFLPRYELVARRIPDNAAVLDIGCGDGAFLEYLRHDKPNAYLCGTDVSAEGIKLLQQRGIDGFVLDPRRPLQNQVARSFDCVVLMEVLEHVHYAEELVRQALQLKPMRLFITIPNMGYFVNRLRLALGGRTPITICIYHMREHIRFWTVKDFREWMDVLNCNVVGVWGAEGHFMKLGRRFPGLFAAQVVYEVVPRSVQDTQQSSDLWGVM